MIEGTSFVIKEPMDYKAFAKRAKTLARQNKESAVKAKTDGTVKQVANIKGASALV